MECQCCRMPLIQHKFWINEKVAICNRCFSAFQELKKHKPGVADKLLFLLNSNQEIPLKLLNGYIEGDNNYE
jgi:hypothetical protein